MKWRSMVWFRSEIEEDMIIRISHQWLVIFVTKLYPQNDLPKSELRPSMPLQYHLELDPEWNYKYTQVVLPVLKFSFVKLL